MSVVRYAFWSFYLVIVLHATVMNWLSMLPGYRIVFLLIFFLVKISPRMINGKGCGSGKDVVFSSTSLHFLKIKWQR